VTLAAEYKVEPAPPSIEAYLRLRRTPGLSHKTPEQATAGINGAWFAAHVVHIPSGEAVAMGRVLGDGGWYFHIIDLATSVEHQRKGLGAAIMARCLQEIRDKAPPGAFVTLLADPPGRKLYEKFGFLDSAPASVGMVREGS
jgi:GNAT superfamily N-acetyltransferase